MTINFENISVIIYIARQLDTVVTSFPIDQRVTDSVLAYSVRSSYSRKLSRGKYGLRVHGFCPYFDLCCLLRRPLHTLLATGHEMPINYVRVPIIRSRVNSSTTGNWVVISKGQNNFKQKKKKCLFSQFDMSIA